MTTPSSVPPGAHPPAAGAPDPRRLVGPLFLAAMILLAAFVVSAAGWWLAARRARVENLSSQERQAIVSEMLEQSPGVYRWAYYEPRIGFTLRPNSALRAYGEEFTSNDLGYRTHPSRKAPSTYRVVFVGDSWTYGMGVKREEAFPAVFEAVARRAGAGGGARNVEAWTLALPGYNTFNEVHALAYFFDRLRPDEVVFTLSGNDNHSTLAVLPTGSTSALGVERDEFGDPHSVTYNARYVSSFRYRQRWRESLALLAETERRMADLGVPTTLFFLARWDPEDAHAMVSGNGLRSPYVVVPDEFTRGEWKAKKWGHGSPAANRLYGEMIYRAIARRAGWPLPTDLDPRSEAPSFVRAPPGDWQTWVRRQEETVSRETVPTDFRPGRGGAAQQAVGPFEGRTGVLGRATTIFVRRDGAAPRLAVTLRRLPDARGLYPLDVEVRIPSPSGGTVARATIEADGDETRRVVIDVPADLDAEAVLDVVLVASRTTSSLDTLAPRSLIVEAIDNLGPG